MKTPLSTEALAGLLAFAGVATTNHLAGGTLWAQAAAPAGITVEAIEPSRDEEAPVPSDSAWLGVATGEASEALTAQLNLQPGVGLVVTYVSPESPAAKVGLQKYDVLVRFDDQSLVHPAQLRKLVRAQKEGQEVRLTFYHAGKEQTASVTLAKAPLREAAAAGGDSPLNLEGLHQQLKDLHLDETVREQLKSVQQALANLKLDQRVQAEIRHGITQARQAVREALREATNAIGPNGPVRRALEDLAQSGVTVDTNATVTVRSAGKGAKSLIQSDQAGTIVIVANPKPHLTAHDPKGELLFDGEIATKEQQAEVPRSLWKRVEPLLDKLNGPEAEEPESGGGK